MLEAASTDAPGGTHLVHHKKPKKVLQGANNHLTELQRHESRHGAEVALDLLGWIPAISRSKMKPLPFLIT